MELLLALAAIIGIVAVERSHLPVAPAAIMVVLVAAEVARARSQSAPPITALSPEQLKRPGPHYQRARCRAAAPILACRSVLAVMIGTEARNSRSLSPSRSGRSNCRRLGEPRSRSSRSPAFPFIAPVRSFVIFAKIAVLCHGQSPLSACPRGLPTPNERRRQFRDARFCRCPSGLVAAVRRFRPRAPAAHGPASSRTVTSPGRLSSRMSWPSWRWAMASASARPQAGALVGAAGIRAGRSAAAPRRAAQPGCLDRDRRPQRGFAARRDGREPDFAAAEP